MTSRRRVFLAVAVIVLVAGAFVLGDRASEAVPAEGSVDVGFARDMGVHHAQAVMLAELMRDRTIDGNMRLVATDVALTQQSQIGQMRGWLDAWGRPPTSVEPPMGWMDHDGDEPMPGLATDEEVAALTAATGRPAEVLFLQLMIRHHEGGLHMAEVAAADATEPYVRALARSMVESQTADIANMTDLLAARGVQYGGS